MREDDVIFRRWDSAFDFRRVVVPIIEGSFLSGGHVISVEDAPRHPAIDVVDMIGGIDAWFISRDGSRLQGIAQRTQWGAEPFESFTIRFRRPSGAMTEMAKRLEALRSPSEHYVTPHYTVQAWVERPRVGRALLVMMVATQDLFEFIERHRHRIESGRKRDDGTEFVIVWVKDLRAAGFRVFEVGEPGIKIRMRRGPTWIPADDVDARDADEECKWCAYDVFDDLCAACGRFQP